MTFKEVDYNHEQLMLKQLMLTVRLNTADFTRVTIEDPDEGIRYIKLVKDSLAPDYTKHICHDSSGVMSYYNDAGEATVCIVYVNKDPNSQDTKFTQISIHPDVLMKYEALQKELFKLLL